MAFVRREKKTYVYPDRLSKDWTWPIYAFFKPIPKIKYVDKKRCHKFECGAKYCKGKSCYVRRFLHTADKNSSGNLQRHAKKCLGEDVIEEANNATNADEVRNTTAGKQKGKGKVMFSTQQHTKAEARYSLQPFDIVKDRAFVNLMKTGQPKTYIPSPSTILRNVKVVFAKTLEHVAKLLQEHKGALNFITDAWTLPNHCSFIAFSVVFEVNSEQMILLLDFIEVAKSHTGLHLATVFVSMLKELGIADKASMV
ncbi:hypothetical protein B0H34DRAFT_656671 [Crassisporium funariophilum]|nr:hypothetical protein B0H34DRAFT_656671 [Crassisporium funariophilum]